MTTEVSGREVARRLRGDGNRTGIRQAAQAKLSVNQMCWRRRKILQLGENKFKSEFPINAVECFQFAEAELAFIPGELIAPARKSKLHGSGALILGFDPAYSESGDWAVMAWRRGREVLKTEKRRGLNAMGCAGWLKAVIDAERPAAVYVDAPVSAPWPIGCWSRVTARSSR